MKIDIKTEGGAAVARLSGEIDHHNAKDLRSQLDKYIISTQPRELVMDFKNITFMDSSGIGLIMGRTKLMGECGELRCVRRSPISSVFSGFRALSG